MGTKPLPRKESLLVRLLEGIFVRLPLALAGVLLEFLSRMKKRSLKWIILGIFSTGALILVFRSRVLFSFIHLVLDSAMPDPWWRTGVKFLLFYLAYLVILSPLFLVVAHFNQETKGSLLKKGDSGRKEPSPKRMLSHRFGSSFNRVYVGESFHSRKPVYLTNDQRLMHCEVVGSTGTGKTESVLLPILAHDLSHGKGAIVIDGKGDLELLDRILYIVTKKRRRDDFLFFSLAHPDKSNTYNPLLRGNGTELKDKIVGSMPWSEEFYRRMAEQAALTLINALVSKGEKVRFRDLHTYLTDVEALQKLINGIQDTVIKDDLGRMVQQFKNNPKFLSGLMADLYLTSRSEFSDLLDVEDPEIDLLDVYKKNRIVYFQLNLQGYGDTAKRMGRIILQDIRTVSSFIQAHIWESKRHFFPVFIDDASSFLEVNFIDFLNKARASQFAITLLHQSPGDLVFRRDTSFQQQVIENTNIKIILRQDDPYSVEKLTKIGGTRKTLISTYQTEEKFLGKGLTGVGSIREGQAFRVDPDLVRALKRGEAVVIWKSPSFHTDYVKLDFFGVPAWSGIFMPARKTLAKETKKESLPQLSSEKPSEETKNETKEIPAQKEEPSESSLSRIESLRTNLRKFK